MLVSLIQRLVSRAVARVEGPLQSRADQNTRKPESGGQPGKNEARGRADGGAKGRMKATQSVKTTKAVSLDGTAADTPGNLATARAELSEGSLAKSRSGAHPRPLPRGETL